MFSKYWKGLLHQSIFELSLWGAGIVVALASTYTQIYIKPIPWPYFAGFVLTITAMTLTAVNQYINLQKRISGNSKQLKSKIIEWLVDSGEKIEVRKSANTNANFYIVSELQSTRVIISHTKTHPFLLVFRVVIKADDTHKEMLLNMGAKELTLFKLNLGNELTRFGVGVPELYKDENYMITMEHVFPCEIITQYDLMRTTFFLRRAVALYKNLLNIELQRKQNN